MKIYYIEQNVFHGWDSYGGHVIIANNEEEARNLAMDRAADEGPIAWETAKIEYIGDYAGDSKNSFILLSDFHAG